MSYPLENVSARSRDRITDVDVVEPFTNDDAPQSSFSQQLELVDGGGAAWRFLGAAFMFEALLWGFPLSYGVFQDYYSHRAEFRDSGLIPLVGTIASGISYLGAPIAINLIKRYQKYQRHMIWTGWVLSMAGLIAGSFATTLAGLIITQGVMYGVGFLIFYYPVLSMTNEWWVTRRGMAYGILCSSTGLSGVAMPFVLEALLNKYGYATTLRAVAVALILLTGPLIPFLKGRLPATENRTEALTDWSFVKNPLFFVLSASNLLQALGYFFPALYLPSYATTIGLSSVQGALLLTVMSVTQVLGQFTFGYLSDKQVSLTALVMLSTVVSAAAALTLWGFAHSLPLLITFSLVYGFFGAGYVAMWARMGMRISEEPTTTLTVFGLFCAGKGVGNVLSGPLSLGLLSMATDLAAYGATKYMGVIVFTGTSMLVSASCVGAWSALGKVKRSSLIPAAFSE